jgi:iron complex outermembrane recepter protein
MHARLKRLPVTLAVMGALYGIQGHAADDAQAQSKESAADEETALDSVVVFGKKTTRQVSEISRADLDNTAPGTSPIKALSTLPGVNYNSPDSFGNYEWGSRISIRGFNQNQLGFTLDDVPLGDMSYRNYNGLHISRAISSENIGRIVVSQGTGALGTASSSNLGGTIQFYSLEPAEKQGVKFEQSFAEYDNRRTFARFDSGLLSTGTKFAISATEQNADKWKGHGEQRHQLVNFKLTQDFDIGKFTGFINYSDRKDVDYMDLSKSSARRLGYRWDYFAPDWALAQQVATQVGAGGTVGNITSLDDAYYNGSGLREDWLVGGTLALALSDTVSLKTTIYHHDQDGTGTWWTPYRASPGGTPISLRTLEFDINRSGIMSALTYNQGIHSFNAGFWYENNDFQHAMRFYAQDNGPSSPYRRPSNPFFTAWNYQFDTNTLQLHFQDNIKLSDQLTVNAGFKSLDATTSVSTLRDTAAGNELRGSLTASDHFLPSLGLNFKLDEQNEFFADAAENVAAFRGVVKGGASPFDTTQAGFNAIKGSIKPEESLVVEGGWRYRQPNFNSSVALYHVDFKNRLLALQQGSGIVGNPSVLTNVGKVETVGAEFSANWSPITNVWFNNSLTLNQSKYRDDFSINNTVFRTDGKNVVDAPKTIVSSQLKYNDGSLYGQIGANYIGQRYYTYTNDQSVSGYTIWDISGGYRWRNVSLAKNVNVQIGVNNLFDKKYFAFGDNPYQATDPTGDAYNLLAGAPRTAFVRFAGEF